MALAQLHTLLVNVHPASVLEVARRSATEANARLQNVGVQYLRRAYWSIPRDIRTQDLKFPVCCGGTCTSLTKVPAVLNTSIPVTGPIFTSSL